MVGIQLRSGKVMHGPLFKKKTNYAASFSSRDLVVRRTSNGAHYVQKESQLNAVYRLAIAKDQPALQNRADANTCLKRFAKEKIDRAIQDDVTRKESTTLYRAADATYRSSQTAANLQELLQLRTKKLEADKKAEKSASWRRGDHPLLAALHFMQSRQYGVYKPEDLRNEDFFDGYKAWIRNSTIGGRRADIDSLFRS